MATGEQLICTQLSPPPKQRSPLHPLQASPLNQPEPVSNACPNVKGTYPAVTDSVDASQPLACSSPQHHSSCPSRQAGTKLTPPHAENLPRRPGYPTSPCMTNGRRQHSNGVTSQLRYASELPRVPSDQLQSSKRDKHGIAPTRLAACLQDSPDAAAVGMTKGGHAHKTMASPQQPDRVHMQLDQGRLKAAGAGLAASPRQPDPGYIQSDQAISDGLHTAGALQAESVPHDNSPSRGLQLANGLLLDSIASPSWSPAAPTPFHHQGLAKGMDPSPVGSKDKAFCGTRSAWQAPAKCMGVAATHDGSRACDGAAVGLSGQASPTQRQPHVSSSERVPDGNAPLHEDRRQQTSPMVAVPNSAHGIGCEPDHQADRPEGSLCQLGRRQQPQQLSQQLRQTQSQREHQIRGALRPNPDLDPDATQGTEAPCDTGSAGFGVGPSQPDWMQEPLQQLPQQLPPVQDDGVHETPSMTPPGTTLVSHAAGPSSSMLDHQQLQQPSLG